MCCANPVLGQCEVVEPGADIGLELEAEGCATQARHLDPPLRRARPQPAPSRHVERLGDLGKVFGGRRRASRSVLTRVGDRGVRPKTGTDCVGAHDIDVALHDVAHSGPREGAFDGLGFAELSTSDGGGEDRSEHDAPAMKPIAHRYYVRNANEIGHEVGITWSGIRGASR